MKFITGIVSPLCLLTASAFAAPAYPLDELLLRAKVVCVADVATSDGTNVVLAVQTNMRGDPGTNTLRFKVDAAWGLPEKGQRYFVFSQGDEPKDEIKLSQGLDCQVSYCGWIMLPIIEIDGVLVVKNAFSFKFRKPEDGMGPLTFEQAKVLVEKPEFKNEKNSEQSVPGYPPQSVGSPEP